MQVKVPDIGDFDEVPVIEIHVAPGDTVAKEDPLVTLESDKATMDVPSPEAGTVKEVLVSVNDKVAEGTPILELEGGSDDSDSDSDSDSSAGDSGASGDEESARELPRQEGDADSEDDGGGEVLGSLTDSSTPSGEGSGPPDDSKGEEVEAAVELPDADKQAEVLVVGAGIGGYTAAFRAADLGKKVILVERYERLGGVCLNVGCIPSKALLHAARVVSEVEEAEGFGITFGKPKVDLDALRGWKDEVVGKLTGGLEGLAKRREVEVVTGVAKFTGERIVEVDGTTIAFENCVIAAGSRAAMLPDLPDDERIVDSTGALELPEVPKRLLVIGGGIIGLEMATVYDALGSEVSVVELTDELIPGCDRDLVKPLAKRIGDRYKAILLGTKVSEVKANKGGIKVTFEGEDAPDPQTYDRVLVAVGRRGNGDRLDLDAVGVEVDERGLIGVDEQQRTNVSHVFAIGDIAAEPMLAHKASHEGKVAAEVIAGENVAFEPRSIPSVAYTDPEVAWTGLTETEAVAGDVAYEKASFTWQASGRALATARADGVTKMLVDPESRRVLGVGIVGVNAGELIAEAVLALEMGADEQDIALTIHPHPTLSETTGFAAEMSDGSITDLMPPKRR